MSSGGKDVLSGLTAAQRQLLEQRLKGARRGPLAAIARRASSDRAPLSFAQQGLWFLDRLNPGGNLYNIAMGVRLSGPLDVDALAASFNDVVRRHEVLRTTFRQENEQAVQICAASLDLRMEVTDLSALPEELRVPQAQRIARAEGGFAFDLERGPLLRVHLLRMGATEHQLLLTVHHIVFDGWSTGVLLKELAACYEKRRGRPAEDLAELPIQFGDFAAWQREWLAGEAGSRQMAYWRDQMHGAPELLELPTDRVRPAVPSGRGSVEQLALGAALTQAVKALSRSESATLFTLILAVLKVLLLRYSGQEDLVVGTPVANRNRRELEPLIGYFVNMLALRTVVGGNPSFRELLSKVRDVVNGALANPDVPFDQLVEMLRPARVSSHNPIFQVGYQYQVGAATVHRLSDLTFDLMANETDAAKFDLTLSVAEEPDDIVLSFEYSSDLFERSTAARMLVHMRTLLEGVVRDPARAVRHLPMLTQSEREQVIFEWNEAASAAKLDVAFPHMFEEQAARTPDASALVFEGQVLSYRDLNERATRLGMYLRARGIAAESRVALCLERSIDLVVGLLGVMKAGGAYVPLDPAYPTDRLNFMLEDSGVAMLLTQSSLVARLPQSRPVTLCMDTQWEEIAAQASRELTPVRPEDLAYVVYTSGSTGRPKGVLLHHRGLTNLVEAQSRAFAVGPGRKVLQFASFSFDAAISEIGMALTTGATLHLIRQSTLARVDALADYLREHSIDVITLPPSLLAVLDPKTLPELRTIISAGEACPWEIALRWKEGRAFFNAYGPTESTVGPTFYRVGERIDAARTVPIGRPISNMRIYVLDAYGEPVPVSVPGEVHIGGVGVARGYLNRPELTEARFVQDHISGSADSRLYRSGDLARFLPDGNLEFLGRIDQQQKIRGFRVEIGEIESVIATNAKVREAAVVVQDVAGDKRVLACVVSREDLTEAELRRWLEAQLPAYMMPSALLFMEKFPLTPNGKVDRKVLLPLATHALSAARIEIAPRSASEQMVARVFAEVLAVDKVGVLDNFFELGGHSLMAARLMARLRVVSGHDIPLRNLFDHPTVAGLAEVVDALEWSARQAVPTQDGDREEIEF